MTLSIPPDVAKHLKLLSHSSDELLNDCTRKYEIQKLRANFGAIEYDNDFHLDYGSVVGLGVQEYLTSKDLDKAYFKMFTAWKSSIDSDDGAEKKKDFWNSLIAVDKFKVFFESEMRGLELVSFDNEPATELGFVIDLGDGFKYRGFLDGLLWNELSEQLVPFEIKTSGGYTEPNEAEYRNKGQHRGYKLIIDAVSKRLNIKTDASYDALYAIYKPMKSEWFQFNFKTSNVALAKWLKGLLSQKTRIEMMTDINFWSINGSSCYKYFKPCKFYGVCESDDRLLFGNQWEKVQPRIEDESKKYKFHFHIDELIQLLLES